jgi:exosome complex RNA-binding protein Rrp42 (RNase PH superfamily)
MDTLRTLDPLSFYDHFRSTKKTRPDGRLQHEIRETRQESFCLSSEISDGSSSITLGSTSILANVTCIPLSPNNDNLHTSDSSSIAVTVLLPERRSGRVLFSSSSSRSGALALRLEHALNLCLKRSSLDVNYMLLGDDNDKNKVSNKSSKQVERKVALNKDSTVTKQGWQILLELVCTSYDGNITDAAFLSACTALRCTTYPTVYTTFGVEIYSNGHRFLAKSVSKGLEFLYFPISFTLVRIKGGSEFVCDPSSSNIEDDLLSSLISGSAVPLGTTTLSTAIISIEVPLALCEKTQRIYKDILLNVSTCGYPTIEESEVEEALMLAQERILKLKQLIFV